MRDRKQPAFHVRRRPGKSPSPAADRFWEHVDKNGPIHPVYGQCWTWTGGVNLAGYGVFHPTRLVSMGAHKFSWMLERSDPGDLWVLHRCDNPPCVKPDHLFLGTRAENIADMIAKGGHAGHSGLQGANNPAAKLTDNDVIDIRTLRTFGARCIDLARSYAVDRNTIRLIVNGQMWAHL